MVEAERESLAEDLQARLCSSVLDASEPADETLQPGTLLRTRTGGDGQAGGDYGVREAPAMTRTTLSRDGNDES